MEEMIFVIIFLTILSYNIKMNINWKPLLFTVGLYMAIILAVLITDKLYTQRGANDITGPPFMRAALGAVIILFFFLRSIYQAIAVCKSYWLVAVVHLLLILIIVFKFMI